MRSFLSTMMLGAFMVSPTDGRCADRTDLDAAFLATFGQRAPLVRTVQRPVYDTSEPPKPVKTEPVVFEVRPSRLVPLGGHTRALISYEADRRAGHGDGGEIAVSYLERTANGWTLEHLWPELLPSGVGGEPANAGAELHRFGADPLFMARSAYCGMGECSEWIGVIRLSRRQPIAYKDVLAGAVSPYPGTPVPSYDGNTCRNYDVRALVEPPRRSDALFSIQYDGWTAPPGALSPKTPLHLLTSYVPDGPRLVMQPSVPVPTCGR